MPIPLRLQTSDAFLGTQEGIHSIILPDIYSSGGSINVWMDKFAQVRRILGYDRANTSPVTTDTGASATLVRALRPYRKTTSGVFTRQVLGCFDDGTDEFELHYSTNEGVTWTFIADLGSGSVDSVPCFSQFGDTLFFTNGVVAPRTWDGTTWATAGSTQLAAPTAVSAGTGRLTGTKQWKIVPVKTDGTRKIASVASTVLSVESERVTVTWLADADATVAGYEVYATSGTGKVFYFEDYVDGIATVTYESNLDDGTLVENRVLEEHGDAPPTAYLCVVHKQRMWYLRTDAAPRDVYPSDPGDPDSVWEDNGFTLSDEDTQGDVITGALGNFENMLVVFLNTAVFKITGSGQIIGDIPDWSRTKSNAQAGSVNHRVIIKVPAGAKYTDQEGKKQQTATVTLAYLTPLLDIRLFDGDNDIIISHPMKTTLSELDYGSRLKCHALHDSERNEVAWFVPTGGGGECDKAVVWNYQWGVWYEREWALASACQVDSTSEAFVHLGGSASRTIGGRVYTLWSGNDFDATAFDAHWMTKTIYGQDDNGRPVISHRKRYRWLDLLFETNADVQIEIGWFPGGAPDNAAATDSITVAPSTESVLSFEGNTVLTSQAATIQAAEATTQVKVGLKTNGQYLYDYGMRLRIGDGAGNSGSWAVQAYTLAYQILPGLARRRFTEAAV